MDNITIDELEEYFSVKQTNSKEWMQIKRVAIHLLIESGFKNNDISDIIGIGRKAIWEIKKEKPLKSLKKDFEVIIREKLYPKKINKVEYKYVKSKK
jgi:hypothetical protein